VWRALSAKQATPATKAKLAVAGILLTCAALVLVAAAGLGATRGASVSAATSAAFPRSASAYARNDIPSAYMKLYAQAARRYHLDWATLAAVGQIESNHGGSPIPGVKSGTNRAGAAGPTQFLAKT
jgi:hypothetical protein